MDTQLLILFCVFIAYGPAYSNAIRTAAVQSARCNRAFKHLQWPLTRPYPGSRPQWISYPRGDAQAPWSYEGDTGPEFWSTLEGGEMCGGSSQSPIDFQSDSAAEKEFTDDPFSLTGFDSDEGVGPHPTRIYNTGTSVWIDLEGDYYVRGAGLPDIYKAFLLDIHWGSDSTKGSEHTVDGQQYAGEFQITHYNTKYGTVQEAFTAPEGLAVFAWGIEIGEHNVAWDPIFNSLSEVKYNGDSYSDLPFFKIRSLVPPDYSVFYRYNGSKPSPPCQENTIWTFYEPRVTVSEDQIAMLRTLSRLTEAEAADGQADLPLVNNFRPVQPLNMRTVYHAHADLVPWDDEGNSCANRCGNFDEMASCQCNSVCQHKGDCCEDYVDNCLVELCTYVPTFRNKMRKQKQVIDEPTR